MVNSWFHKLLSLWPMCVLSQIEDIQMWKLLVHGECIYWIGSSKISLLLLIHQWLMCITSSLQIISSHEFSQDMLDEKLKENERRRRKAVKNVDLEMSQYLEDERLAIALQNSEFLQELRGNEDFMKTLEKGNWILLLFYSN